MVDSEIYNVTISLINNYNTLLPNIPQSKDNHTMELGQLIYYIARYLSSKTIQKMKQEN